MRGETSNFVCFYAVILLVNFCKPLILCTIVLPYILQFLCRSGDTGKGRGQLSIRVEPFICALKIEEVLEKNLISIFVLKFLTQKIQTLNRRLYKL